MENEQHGMTLRRPRRLLPEKPARKHGRGGQMNKAINTVFKAVVDDTIDSIIESFTQSYGDMPDCNSCLMEGGMFVLTCGHRMCISCHGGTLEDVYFDGKMTYCGYCRSPFLPEESDCDYYVAKYCRHKCPNEGKVCYAFISCQITHWIF